MYKQAYIILIFQIFLICKIQSQEESSRDCFRYGGRCNPLYMCLCCPKLYFEDKTRKVYRANTGYFCNMEGAITSYRVHEPYPQGYCQECTSEGDGCTSELRPCCPDQTPEPDASCPAGQTSCKRKYTNNTVLVGGEYEPNECAGTLPKCYGETNYCYRNLTECCENMYCKQIDPKSSGEWGVCTRVEGYTGELTPALTGPAIGYTQPVVPRANECWNLGLAPPPTTPPAATTPSLTTPAALAGTTPSLTTPTALAETTPSLTTSAALAETTPSLTTPAALAETTPTNAKPKSSCATEGMYCERGCCCKGLDCPNNWWPLYITRWVLNWFDIWNRVCRDYSPFAWYNPFTWFHY